MGSLFKWLMRSISYSLEPSPERKGELGEARLEQKVDRYFRGRTYHFLHDVTIPDYDGTTQIDHVLVVEQGVFVIETKNYKGWIFGSEQERTWTQTFRTRKHRIQNPLRQNYNHLKAVRAAVRLPQRALHSLVVFVGSAEFRTPMPHNVVTLGGLNRYFDSFHEALLTERAMVDVCERLEAVRLAPGSDTDERHRKHLEEVRANPVCPRCGRTMVVRTARNGPAAGREFWGCSGFPQCRSTKSR